MSEIGQCLIKVISLTSFEPASMYMWQIYGSTWPSWCGCLHCAAVTDEQVGKSSIRMPRTVPSSVPT